MSTYKLLYAGEVLEGQHPAVVRKRLAALLKLDDERMDVLFSGKVVVVKKSADDALKTRYESAFEKAGAKLLIKAINAEPDVMPSETATEPDPNSVPGNESGDLQALPPGSDILSETERSRFVPANIETDHLKVQGAVFVVESEPEAVEAPNVDHLSMADAGALLSTSQAASDEPEIVIEFDLAEVGADIGTPADLPDPVAPDTSHLQLLEPDPS